MIEFISYEKIDRDAYDRCIRESLNFRIYALSWYLDATAPVWDLLVLDDYRAVMPLPRRKKYGLTYVYTPVLVQQLGVFSPVEISEDTEYRFFKKAASRYFLLDYFLHSASRCRKIPRVERRNYLLDLSKGHAEISKGLNTNRKRILKQGFEKLRIDGIGDSELFLRMVKQTDLPFEPEPSGLKALERLVKSNRDAIRTWNVFHEDQWAGGLVWALDHKRITYLFPVSSPPGKDLNAPTYIVDSLIREYENSGLMLDFEGSMIPGTESFYRSFGAKEEVYYYWKSRCYGLI